jgi:EAL and modified HD-GYP domain-containing signal transduction protein
VRRVCGASFGYTLRDRAALPRQGAEASRVATPVTDMGAVTDALRSVFRDLGADSTSDTVFVRVTRPFLSGDLPIPRHPERIVVEADAAAPCDAAVRDGLLRLKALGCRVLLGDFTGRADQRALLPFADFVAIDARDLDLEGRPLLDLAASRGAQLVADHVDTSAALRECRAAGFALVQGRAVGSSSPRFRPSMLSSAAGR